MSLLPHNATLLERSLERAGELGVDTEIIRGVADSARCPPSFLPWLGWALKVEGWEAAYTDAQRRELIREAIPVHKTKGTVGAIRRELAKAYDRARIAGQQCEREYNMLVRQ